MVIMIPMAMITMMVMVMVVAMIHPYSIPPSTLT